MNKWDYILSINDYKKGDLEDPTLFLKFRTFYFNQLEHPEEEKKTISANQRAVLKNLSTISAINIKKSPKQSLKKSPKRLLKKSPKRASPQKKKPKF